MYVFLGWLNIGLIAVMTSPFWLRFLSKRIPRLRSEAYRGAIKFLRAIHKPLGAAILVIALIHGYLAWGTLRLHTGTILWLSVLITALLGASFYLFKKKQLFVWHKRMALLVVLLLTVHLLFPALCILFLGNTAAEITPSRPYSGTLNGGVRTNRVY